MREDAGRSRGEGAERESCGQLARRPQSLWKTWKRGDPRRGESGGRLPVRLWGGRAGPVYRRKLSSLDHGKAWEPETNPHAHSLRFPGDTPVCCPIHSTFVEEQSRIFAKFFPLWITIT